MSSPESQAYIADELGLLPTSEKAYELVKDNAQVTAWEEPLKVSKPRPWIPEGGLFFTPLDAMATKTLVKGDDVSSTLDATAKTYKSDVVPEYELP